MLMLTATREFWPAAARLIVGIVRPCAQASKYKPIDDYHEDNKRQSMQARGRTAILFPGFPAGSTTFGTVARSVGLGVHSAPNSEYSTAKQEGDGHDLKYGLHNRTLGYNYRGRRAPHDNHVGTRAAQIKTIKRTSSAVATSTRAASAFAAMADTHSGVAWFWLCARGMFVHVGFSQKWYPRRDECADESPHQTQNNLFLHKLRVPKIVDFADFRSLNTRGLPC